MRRIFGICVVMVVLKFKAFDIAPLATDVCAAPERDVEEVAGPFRHGVADADDVELQRTSVGQHSDDADEGRRRARDGIHEVFDACHLRLPRALMGVTNEC